MATTAGSPFPSSDDTLMGDDVHTAGSVKSHLGKAASAAASAAADAVSAPTSGANDLLNRVVSGAHQTIDRLADTVAPHVQRMQDGVSTANQSLHARTDDMREMGDEWADSVRSTVRENPLAAVAAAVAIGILVAKLSS